MDYFSQLLVWKMFLSRKLIFSVEKPCTSRGVQCETATFEPHNGRMNLDTEWPFAKQTGRDIKRLRQEEKWKRGCICAQPPYRNNTKHTHYVISQKSVLCNTCKHFYPLRGDGRRIEVVYIAATKKRTHMLTPSL